MKAGDKIRVFEHYPNGLPSGTRDYLVEEFRHCLGIFLEETDRVMQRFTPLCELYEPAPDSESKHMGNCGPYHTKYVQSFMNLTKEK